MKRPLTQCLVLISALFFLNSCALFKPEMKVVGEVPLSTVFGKVLDQYKQADSLIKLTDIGKHRLTITEADAIFDNVITNEQDASLSLLIFKAGYTHSKKKETTITYSLVGISGAKAANFLSHNVSKNSNNPNALRDLIVSSYQQFIKVAVPKDIGDFEKDIEIDISFTVDQTGNIEVSGPIGKFTPDVTLSRDVANTHTITIKLAIDKK
jgi:hypothetical protein